MEYEDNEDLEEIKRKAYLEYIEEIEYSEDLEYSEENKDLAYIEKAAGFYREGKQEKPNKPERVFAEAWSSISPEIWLRREHGLGEYYGEGWYGHFLDFAHIPTKLAIEIDGKYHEKEERKAKDRLRDKELSIRGWRTIRIPADEVIQNPEYHARGILRLIEAEQKQTIMPNSVTLVGTVVSTPQFVSSANGLAKCTFTLEAFDPDIKSSNRYWNRWLVRMLGRSAETCRNHLKQGKGIEVRGTIRHTRALRQNRWTCYMEVVSAECRFISGEVTTTTNIELTGYLGKNPLMEKAENGKDMAILHIANNSKIGDMALTTWIRAVVLDELASQCSELMCGQSVWAVGNLRHDWFRCMHDSLPLSSLDRTLHNNWFPRERSTSSCDLTVLASSVVFCDFAR